jgi:hypothetical protein
MRHVSTAYTSNPDTLEHDVAVRIGEGRWITVRVVAADPMEALDLVKTMPDDVFETLPRV